MQARFIQDGDFIDYTPDADVAAGAVVAQGSLVGIALRPIPANTQGSLAVSGIFAVSKGEGTAFSVGDDVYWVDGFADKSSSAAAGDPRIGVAVQAAVSAAPTVMVRLGHYSQVMPA